MSQESRIRMRRRDTICPPVELQMQGLGVWGRVSSGFGPPVAPGSGSCNPVPKGHISEQGLQMNRNSNGFDHWAKLGHCSLTLKAIGVTSLLVREIQIIEQKHTE